MVSSGNGDSRKDFARAFGRALRNFIRERGKTQVQVADLLGLTDRRTGKPSKSRLGSYLADSPKMPEAQVLYLACTKLDGFRFEHDGFRITAETLRRKGPALQQKLAQQMTFRLNRRFNLTDRKGGITEMGALAVKVKRPPGRIEFAVSVRATERGVTAR